MVGKNEINRERYRRNEGSVLTVGNTGHKMLGHRCHGSYTVYEWFFMQTTCLLISRDNISVVSM